MQLEKLVFASLALFLGTLGYFFGAIVLAIYAALALGKDKMAFESGIAPHLFGAAGALAGAGLALVIMRLYIALRRQTAFVPENELEAALVAAAADPARRPEFYRTLLRSKLFLLDESTEARPPGSIVLQPGATIPIRDIEINGQVFVPLYSSALRIRSGARPARYLALEARAILELVGKRDVFLNPGSEYGKHLTPGEIQQLLTGSAPMEQHIVRTNETWLIGQPPIRPTRIIEALADHFRSRPSVRAAYFAQVAQPSAETPPHLLIGIDAEGPWEEATRGMQSVLDRVIQIGELVDVTRMDESTLSARVIELNMPFYVRGERVQP
jgi:hypothetical protein